MLTTPGTYNGSVTITPTSGGQAITIPVALTVTDKPAVTVSPSSVNLAYQIGGSTNNAQQTVTVTAPGTQARVYGLLLSVDPNPANQTWFTVTPSSGSIPAKGNLTLTFTYLPSFNLPAGTYTGKATLQTVGGNPTQQDIPVKLVVSNSPLVSLSTSTLNFTAQAGGPAPATQNVTVNSTNGATNLTLSATTNTPAGFNWLAVPATTTAGTPIPVSVNPAGLAPGSYTGTITITAAGASNSPLQVAVNLTITNDPIIVVSANGCTTATFANCPLLFPSQTGQSPVPSQLVRVTSSTGIPLNYSVTTNASACGGNWLQVSGGTNNSTDGVFSVSVIPTGIAAGTRCDGSVVITATNSSTKAAAPNSPLTIPVTMFVSSSAQLVTGASALTFAGQLLGGPLQQTLMLASTSATDALTYTATAADTNGGWLAVAPQSGTATIAGTNLNVLASPGILSAGTYRGTITITATGPGGAAVADSPMTIPVVFQVNAGTISSDTTSLNFTQVAGGSAPASQSIKVSGVPNAINFTATASADNGGTWLTVSPASGTSPATIQVSANAGTLAVGSYTGKVTITAANPPGATGSPIVIPVTLTVASGQTLTASPNNVNFAYILGTANPANQTVALSSTGGASPFSVKIDQGTGTWLTVQPSSGNTPANLTFAANPQGLAAGKYTATVTISSSAAANPTTVTVSLVVSTPVPPIVTAVTNAASYSTGSVSPGENIVIFGTNLGPAQLALGTVTNGAFDKTAGGLQVLFDGQPAPVIYASAAATSVMVPYGVSGRASTSIRVSYQGVQSDPLVYNVVPAAPGIYSLNQSGTGPGAILNQDFSVNGPATPAAKNSVVSIYMTGEGVTTPPSTDGTIAVNLNKPVLGFVTATVGGVPATVEYAGSAPGILYGVMQVNVRIPTSVGSGAQPIVIQLGASATSIAFATQNGITVAVQ